MKDLSLHLMDILQNSITAGASRVDVAITADAQKDRLTITVSDNGCGMSEDLLHQAANPFTTTRTTRKIGLGIPLFKDSAEAAGGHLNISSSPGKGTRLSAEFGISHIDRLPLGDVGETLAGVIMSNPNIRWFLVLDNKKEQFCFDTQEVKARLAEVPISEYSVIEWIKGYINEGIKIIFGGVLNEVIS
ncbi:MAG: ATP-binding protein [Clostridia bacterium]|nr:ATP-binding protein [Clostridia bacterium]